MKETAIIIGGTSGMGKATAKLLANQGYSVIISGRDQSKLDSTISELSNSGNTSLDCRGFTLDFTNKASTDSFFAKAQNLDHLVLVGSGAPARGNLADIDSKIMQEAFEQKFIGYFNCVKSALPKMNPRGSIIIVTGGASRAAIPGTSAVAGINAGLQAWGLVLAKELAPLRVNILSPGFIDTPLHDWQSEERKLALFQKIELGIPLGRIGKPEEVAQAIHFLISNAYATGTVLDIDGGIRLR